MAELLKKVETYRLSTMTEAENFVKEVKTDPNREGYEVKSYKLIKKEKKSKGEIVEEYVLCEITKVWSD